MPTTNARRQPPAIEVDHLGRVFEPKKRPAVTALDDVSLTIEAGEVHGLLGPNGAGKTTLVKILATVLLPTSGTARILGHDVVDETLAVRRRIGLVLGGERGLYDRLTGRQNLRYWGALFHLDPGERRRRSDALLERVGLAERADDRVQTYSRGMRQRLHLARGLIGDPQVMFLDEPSSGLDPVGAHEFRAMVAELVAEGRTIVLATHDMVEAETVCDRVTLIDQGRILATESPAALSRLVSAFERIECDGADEAVLARVRTLPGVDQITAVGAASVQIHLAADMATSEVMAELISAGVTSVRVSRPSLEEVYLGLIGKRGLGV